MRKVFLFNTFFRLGKGLLRKRIKKIRLFFNFTTFPIFPDSLKRPLGANGCDFQGCEPCRATPSSIKVSGGVSIDYSRIWRVSYRRCSKSRRADVPTHLSARSEHRTCKEDVKYLSLFCKESLPDSHLFKSQYLCFSINNGPTCKRSSWKLPGFHQGGSSLAAQGRKELCKEFCLKLKRSKLFCTFVILKEKCLAALHGGRRMCSNGTLSSCQQKIIQKNYE